MATTLIHSYDTLFDAESAQQQLLASGFSSDHIHLTVREDEAGPVQGNFIVGNGGGDPGARLDSPRGAGVDDKRDYEREFKESVQRSTYLLTVDADDDGEKERAAEILHRYGGADLHPGSAKSR